MLLFCYLQILVAQSGSYFLSFGARLPKSIKKTWLILNFKFWKLIHGALEPRQTERAAEFWANLQAFTLINWYQIFFLCPNYIIFCSNGPITVYFTSSGRQRFCQKNQLLERVDEQCFKPNNNWSILLWLTISMP